MFYHGKYNNAETKYHHIADAFDEDLLIYGTYTYWTNYKHLMNFFIYYFSSYNIKIYLV